MVNYIKGFWKESIAFNWIISRDPTKNSIKSDFFSRNPVYNLYT